jgi:hypothetical protein
MSNDQTHTACMDVCTIMYNLYIACATVIYVHYTWFSFSLILAENIIIYEKRVGAGTFPFYTYTV